MNGSVELTTPLSFLERSEMRPGESVWSHYERLAPQDRPVVCVFNGEPLLRCDWDRSVLVTDNVQFVVMPQGGGAKKLLRAVALIALSVIAPIVAPIIGGALGITSAIGISLISAGLVIAGSFLINALLPPETPGARDPISASPTYSLSAQGNSARLLEPIPRLYGRHIIYPDFASQPYATYEGNDQFLYQLFCLGVGEYDVEEVRIEDTTLWDSVDGFSASFSDVQMEIIPPGGGVTLFPAAVLTSVEVGGQEALCIDAERTVDFATARVTMSTADQDEKLDYIAVGDELVITGSAAVDGTYTVVGTSGTGEWVEVDGDLGTTTGEAVNLNTISWIGPFTANPADRDTDKLQVDIIYPRGLYYANDEGDLTNLSLSVRVQARAIDGAGDPTGSWVTLEDYEHTKKTPTPQRVTRTYNLTLGRYEVRLRRLTNKRADTRYANDVQWGSLRAFIPDNNTFDDVTLMAVVMRATNQLTDQSSRRFNTIQTAKVPVWDGTTWSANQATRNPAWAAADILRNDIYGAGLPDSRIDLQALLSLADKWTTRGDKFDAVFDRKQTLWTSLVQSLMVGRAQPLLIAGKVSFVRDEAHEITRGVMTPRNIIRGSFETTHILYDEDSPDAVIIEYYDERTWERNEVLCKIDGSTEENPARIQMFGVVNRTHAWREGIYQAAVNLYRRVFASLTTEMEGRLLIRGDSVAVSHDMARWGQSAEVETWDAGTRILGLSEPVDDTTTVVGLSDRRGKLWGPVVVASVSADGFSITLDAGDLSAVEGLMGVIPVYLGLEQEPTRAMCGTLDTYSRKFKVVGSTPDKGGTVQMVLTNDDPRVYEADLGTPPDEVSPYGPGTVPTAPVVSGLSVSQNPSSPSSPVLLDASWNAAAGATSYLLQVSPDGVTWNSIYDGPLTSTQFTTDAGPVYVRVFGIGEFRGPAAVPNPTPVTYGTPTLLPGQPQGLTVEADTGAGVLSASWGLAPRATSYRIDVYIDDGGSYTDLVLTRTLAGSSVLFTSTDIASAGGPWDAFRLEVTPINGVGEGTPLGETVTDVVMDPPASVSLVTAYNGQEVNAQWTPVAAASSYDVEVWESATLRATYTVTGTSIVVTGSSLASAGGPWRSLELRVKAQNGALVSTAAVLAISDTAPAVPANITTSSGTTEEVDVAWDASTDAAEYVLYADGTPGFTPGPSNEAYRGGALGVTISGLTPAATVYFRLTAEDSYAGGDGYNISAEFNQLVS